MYMAFYKPETIMQNCLWWFENSTKSTISCVFSPLCTYIGQILQIWSMFCGVFQFVELWEVKNLSRHQVNASNVFRIFKCVQNLPMDHRNKIIMGTEWTKSNVFPKMVKNTPKTSKMVIFSKKVELSAPLQADRNFYGTPKNFLRSELS